MTESIYVTSARFNVKKYLAEPKYYAGMSKEQLAFHDALNRMITCDFQKREISFFHGLKGGRWCSLRIIIPMDTGEINAVFSHPYKNEKAMIRLNMINEIANVTAKFVAICAEHGYLTFQKEGA